MTRRRSRSFALVAAASVVALLAGCTTLPTDSSPQVVKPVAAGSKPVSPDPVAEGANPRAVVNYFLDGNVNVTDVQNSPSQSVLTPDASWATTTGVTILDTVNVGNPTCSKSGGTCRVTVSGQQLGILDKAGRYNPTLSGNGSTQYSRQFVLIKVRTSKNRSPQWRISLAPSGVLLSLDQFVASYHQRVLYFFDSNYPQPTTQFVPEPLYTNITDPSDLANFLLANLSSPLGNQTLQSGFPSVSSTAPEIAVPATNVGVGAVVKIDIPGAGRLDPDRRNALAAEVAITLQQVSAIHLLQITDNGAAVRISAVSGTTFAPTNANLLDRYEPSPPNPALYYVDRGSVLSDTGHRLSVPTMPKSFTDGYSLSSVALHPSSATGDLLEVAATYGTGENSRLAIGTQDKLRGVPKLVGPLSRPSWQPDGQSVWIGAGKDLYRVSPSGATTLFKLNLPGGQQLSAVRVSPDGGRIAMVVSSTGTTAGSTTSQVYVGTISVSNQQITDLQAITPAGLLITDVAWYDELKLFAVGTTVADLNDVVFYDVQCDGSALSQRPSAGLPADPPDSLTVADSSLAVVSVGPTLWRQTNSGDGWNQIEASSISPTNPVYVE